MLLDVSAREERGCTLLTLRGELDVYSGPQVRAQVLELIDAGSRVVLIDMSGVQFMDSSGVSALLFANRRLELQGGELRLAAPTDGVRRLLRLMGLGKVFGIYDDLADALSALPTGTLPLGQSAAGA